ncbi:MAG: peptidoglycan bridge formation glycyltransferase FemA/FemB family protein [Prevotellaceae bacterium]|jgi:hypothetical protein|nr:peptidoglycan bridge formation glycyltransferase FemA/FemB family protein [Prevotellaceae bacterium]
MLKIHANIDEIDKKQWRKLIETSPVPSFFQTQECYDFYCSLSFLEPFVFGVSENEQLTGVICGYVIAEGGKFKRYFSRRAIILGGALLAVNITDSALTKLLDFTVKTLKNRAIYIEFRNYNSYSDNKEIFKNAGFKYMPHLNFHVPTENPQAAFAQLSSTKRHDVKISQNQGAKIVEITTENDLQNYYKILIRLYLTKIKTPLFPYEFFEKIVKLPECKIFGIKFEGKIIGGSICVFLAQKSVYEWFVCGQDGRFKNIYPSTLSTWAAIDYAAQNGFRYFDMMGAGKPDRKNGIREFKAKFGGKLVEHGRFLYLCNNFLYKIGKFYVEKIMKSLK